MRFETERTEVVATAQALFEHGMVLGTSGNVSVRAEKDLLAITPHGITYKDMAPSDIILIDLAGQVVEGDKAPSIETAIHARLAKARTDVRAIVHSHPIHASMFAVAHKPIPAVIDEVAADCGGEVPIAPYAIAGTDDLAQNVIGALGPLGRAALMANHGLVVAHADLSRALALTLSIDRTARIALGAEQLGGSVPLPRDALDLYAKVFRNNVAHKERLG